MAWYVSLRACVCVEKIHRRQLSSTIDSRRSTLYPKTSSVIIPPRWPVYARDIALVEPEGDDARI